MKHLLIVMTGLLTINSYALDEFLPTGKELNKLIEMYGFEVDLPETKVHPIVLGTVNKNNVPHDHQVNDEEDVVGDMVSTIQAAGVEADELIFYEYGKKEKTPPPKDPSSDLTQLINKKSISHERD